MYEAKFGHATVIAPPFVRQTGGVMDSFALSGRVAVAVAGRNQEKSAAAILVDGGYAVQG